MFQKLLVEFLGTIFFLYVILAVGHPLAIGLVSCCYYGRW